MARSLLAILLVTSGVLAIDYRWSGGDTGFSNPDNWADGLVPNGTMPACTTRFGVPGRTIISRLAATTYKVGRTLFFPLSGVLRLSLTGTVIAFTDSGNRTCVNYQWTAGATREQRNDFYCHKNWRDNDSPNTIPDSPPCQGDTAIFDGGSTFDVFVPNNVTLVVVDGLQFGSINILTNYPQNPIQTYGQLLPQIDLVNTNATVFIGRGIIGSQSNIAPFAFVCRPLLHFVGTSTQCKCFTSCPSATQLATQQDIIRVNQLASSAALQALANANITRNFRGNFSAAALSIGPEGLAWNFLNATQVSALNSALQMALSSQLPSYALSVTYALTSDNSTIMLSGSVTTVNSSLYIPGQINNPPNPITWSAISATQSPSATRLQSVIRTTLAPLLLAYYQQQLLDMVAAARSQVDPTVNTLINSITSTPNASNAVNIANGVPCFSTCTTDCASCIANVTDALVNAGINATAAQIIATNIAAAKDASNTTWPDVSTAVSSIASTIANADAAAAQQQQNTPRVYGLTSSPFYLGRTRFLADQLRASNAANRPALAAALLASLSSLSSITAAWNMQISWIASIPSRRRAAILDSAVLVTFQYNISCTPNDAICQSNSSTTPQYAQINTGFGNTFNSFSPQPSPCQLTTSFNETCLTGLASVYCSNQLSTLPLAVSRANTNTYLYGITACGVLPAYPDGTCMDNSSLTTSRTLSASISASCPCTGGSGGSGGGAGAEASSGGGGGGLGMAAGAAGAGILIILIVVVVVVRRKKGRAAAPKSGKGADDRTVVAFENPMYDDPGTHGSFQPTYDNGQIGGAHESEGLYDEPAFNASTKANPVYQSTEDLADGGGGGGDGYLDVAPKTGGAPEDVGYLGGQAEDVGYLGGAPANDTYEAPPDDFADAE